MEVDDSSGSAVYTYLGIKRIDNDGIKGVVAWGI